MRTDGVGRWMLSLCADLDHHVEHEFYLNFNLYFLRLLGKSDMRTLRKCTSMRFE